jgi:hypothetical protein
VKDPFQKTCFKSKNSTNQDAHVGCVNNVVYEDEHHLISTGQDALLKKWKV